MNMLRGFFLFTSAFSDCTEFRFYLWGPSFLCCKRRRGIEIRRGIAEGSGDVNTYLAVMEMEFLRTFSEKY